MVLAFIGLATVAVVAAVLLVLAVDRLLDWWQYRRALRRMQRADDARGPWTDPLVRWISEPRDKLH